MLINVPQNIQGLEKEWTIFMNLYQYDIKTLWDTQWKDEDIVGKSCVMYNIAQYTLAFYYAVMYVRDYNEAILDSDELETKYELDTYRKKFSCNNIDIDLVINTLKIL